MYVLSPRPSVITKVNVQEVCNEPEGVLAKQLPEALQQPKAKELHKAHAIKRAAPYKGPLGGPFKRWELHFPP